jgi:hypothetical protein
MVSQLLPWAFGLSGLSLDWSVAKFKGNMSQVRRLVISEYFSSMAAPILQRLICVKVVL